MSECAERSDSVCICGSLFLVCSFVFRLVSNRSITSTNTSTGQLAHIFIRCCAYAAIFFLFLFNTQRRAQLDWYRCPFSVRANNKRRFSTARHKRETTNERYNNNNKRLFLFHSLHRWLHRSSFARVFFPIYIFFCCFCVFLLLNSRQLEIVGCNCIWFSILFHYLTVFENCLLFLRKWTIDSR